MSIADVATRNMLTRAWYCASIPVFVGSEPDSVVGRLATNTSFAVTLAQRDAWLQQIQLLQRTLNGLDGTVLFEFSIPRMGRRIDAVLLTSSALFVIEFKVGATAFDRSSIEQVWDYALDLKYFHEASHLAPIIPILVATGAEAGRGRHVMHVDPDKVYRPITTDPSGLRELIERALRQTAGAVLEGSHWISASYRPTPTIIEAARALYARHSVADIARNDAGAQNLQLTSSRIDALIQSAKTRREKSICFVTGVPGAGKTLVGLNLATQHRKTEEPMHAVFLSGNGPLVAVLREALTRDEVARKEGAGTPVRKSQVGEGVKAFIQNVHHFRDDALSDPKPPFEHVAIFDEAQRAWDLRRTSNFMHQRKGLPNFSQSEPEFLISCMDRHRDWAAIVCLVGGGQEINTGESGIDTWLEALKGRFEHWRVHVSSRLTDSEYASEKALKSIRDLPNVQFDDDLHLSSSMRSFRAEKVSTFVKALLDCEIKTAQSVLAEFVQRYPIAVTRDLALAKAWVRRHARGSERYGLMTSSKAQRLKPDAIDVRVQVDPVHWFLADRSDTRSSYYLEDAASEFQVQGLEVDWGCVAWDGDLRFNGSGWSYFDFRGSKWLNIHKDDGRRYLRNAYRVLLTRARQGMVLYVPAGSAEDPTRATHFYDPTFRYLAEIGIDVLH